MVAESKKPNFLIVGVARCGTTSLYNYLRQHPEISFSDRKEPKFFSSLDLSFPLGGKGDREVENEMVRTEKAYLNSFSHCLKGQLIGDASSDYFYYHRRTIPRIKKFLGDPKVIIVLRNPYERAFSAYSSLVRDSREDLTFHEGLCAEGKRKELNYDWMWHYRDGSLYADGLRSFKEHFSKVHIIMNHELSSDTLKTLRGCFDFLGVDNKYVPADLSRYSNSGRPRNGLVKYFTKRDGFMYKIRMLVLSLVPRKHLESIAKKLLKKESIDDLSINLLRTHFNRDIEAVESILHKDLSEWKK